MWEAGGQLSLKKSIICKGFGKNLTRSKQRMGRDNKQKAMNLPLGSEEANISRQGLTLTG
jgi:hypothetical protein